MPDSEKPRPLTLATLPTPVEPAPRLAAALGLDADDLWVKRDDLLGLGGGGNKVRKLQHTCAAAIAAGARTLVTTGAAQSNHARLTAAAGARLGLDVELVLAGDPPAGNPTGNLLLDLLLGARLVWAGDVPHEALEEVATERVRALEESGVPTARIPYGGSSATGAQAYVEAGEELLAQLPDLAHVAVAVGSAGTAAGLVVALGAGLVLGVDTGAVADPLERVERLVRELGGDPAGVRLRREQVGAGYSTLTPAVGDALVLAARTEGLVLDPVYTGRALAGLAAAVRDGDVRPGDRTVLLHTGGLPGLFGSAAAAAYVGGLG